MLLLLFIFAVFSRYAVRHWLAFTARGSGDQLRGEARLIHATVSIPFYDDRDLYE